MAVSPRPIWQKVKGLARDPRARLLTEALTVVALLAMLVRKVYIDYLRGTVSPGWDFLSHYTAEAYAWWHDGSFFSPPAWIPYAWGGYPGVADLQNSSWYLPVGLTAQLTAYDLRAAAVLSAAHVVLGALGMYVLGRQWKFGHWVSLVGLCSWFFVGGFYAHGSQLDIHRGYAWIPWVLLILSPRWPWKRWWGPLIAVAVFWQTFLAMYPGALLASVYGIAAWVVTTQLVMRPALKDYLLPAAAAAILGAAMSLLRFLPYSLVSGTNSPSRGDESVLTWKSLAALAYPYDRGELPGDPTMKSLFIPVVVYILLCLVPMRAAITRIAAFAAAPALLLGIPGAPWADAVDLLPGLGVSRFRTDDFKLVFFAALTVLAMAGLAHVVTGGRDTGPDSASSPSPRAWWVRRGGAVVGVLAVLWVLGVTGPYSRTEVAEQWGLAAATAAAVVLIAVSRSQSLRRVLVAGLVVVAAMSGVWSVEASPNPWRQNRVALESLVGAPMRDLMASRVVESTVQRPERAAPTGEFNSFTEYEPRWSRGFYDGSLAVLGYVNLKGSPGFDTIRKQVLAPGEPSDILSFWAAPGIGIVVDDDRPPSADALARCVESGQCGEGIEVKPVSYDPSTPITYHVTSAGDAVLSFNEAFYRGWSARLCDGEGSCEEVPVEAGSFGEVTLAVPQGEHDVTLSYRIPGMTHAWLIFWAAVVGVLAWAVVLRFARPMRGRPVDRDPEAGGTAHIHPASSGERWIARVLRHQVSKFATVGVVNTVVDFGAFVVLSSLGVIPIVANLVSTAMGMAVSFIANRRFVFAPTGRVRREAILFFVVAGTGVWLIQPLIIVAALRVLSHGDSSASPVVFAVAKVMAIAVAAVWNFFLYKHVVFGNHSSSEGVRSRQTRATEGASLD